MVLTVILADATNVGLTRMADACAVASYRQLAWNAGWHLREDTYRSGTASDAMAALIETGGFAAHVKRMRARYRAAWNLAANVLPKTSVGLLRVQSPDQGLHLVATLPPSWPAGSAVIRRYRCTSRGRWH